MSTAPNPPPLVISTAPSHRRQAAKAGFKPATSILDIFDIQFERYVTPIIVKATWLMAIVIGGLLLVANTAAYIESIDPTPDKQSKAVTRQAIEMLPGSREIQRATQRQGETESLLDRKTVYATLIFAARVIGIAIALLWVRVALEATIVLFHIANSVASLDTKTP